MRQRASASSSGLPANVALVASDPDGDALTLRVVSQPVHGTAGLVGTTATYFPEIGYNGADTFTYAAWDGASDSNLGTVIVNNSTPDGIFANGFEGP